MRINSLLQYLKCWRTDESSVLSSVLVTQGIDDVMESTLRKIFSSSSGFTPILMELLICTPTGDDILCFFR